jgi:hypothetical protein
MMITDRWKKFAILVPLAPYLVLVAVLLVAALAVTYYRWKSEIGRAAQAELLNGQQAAEIAGLRKKSGQAEDRAIAAEGRAQELGEELEKVSAISHQLSANLEKLKAKEGTDQARIAALTPVEVAAAVTARVGEAGSEAALRHTLELIADRDACKDQSAIKDLQYANCRESLVDYAAIGEQQTIQIRELKQALDLERRAFDKRDDLAKVQVSAAKGSWFSRFTGKAKWFVVGVGAGAVLGAIAAH